MRPVREGTAALMGVGGADQATAAAAGHIGHAHAHPGLWRTPTPYLLLGFALAVALLILRCTRRKPTDSSRRGSASEEESARGATMAPLDREPKVIVIMPGDHMPSFIASARPFAFARAVDAGEPSNADAA
jgi:hypothetical protein